MQRGGGGGGGGGDDDDRLPLYPTFAWPPHGRFIALLTDRRTPLCWRFVSIQFLYSTDGT